MKLRHLALLIFLTTPCWSQAIPRALHGNWRVTSVLPTQTGCWAGDKAGNLLGTTITYTAAGIRWKDAGYAVSDTYTRTLSATGFRDEYSKNGATLELAALGIHAPRVTELDLQHDDADITDVTTEVPGDTVLLAGPNRILVSVCGTWFQATRTTASAPANQRATQTHTAAHQQPTRKSGL